MKLKRLCVISVWVAVCLIGLVTIVFLVDSFDPEGKEVTARRQRIRELVPIGMNIDEAIEILRANGISVTDKYDPTKSQSYYLADIKIRKEPITFLETLKLGMGKGKVRKRYVALKANWDGVITAISE